MRFWRTQTPAGMLLRSPYRGSDIGDPGRRLTFPRHERANGHPVAIPIPVDRFIEYGGWFQRAAVPDLDERDVRGVERTANGFQVAAGDDVFRARRVVVAAGVGTFAWRPGAVRRDSRRTWPRTRSTTATSRSSPEGA